MSHPSDKNVTTSHVEAKNGLLKSKCGPKGPWQNRKTPAKRYIQTTKTRVGAETDGFRLRKTVDGWRFVEGCATKGILGHGDSRKINDCAQRRGIIGKTRRHASKSCGPDFVKKTVLGWDEIELPNKKPHRHTAQWLDQRSI